MFRNYKLSAFMNNYSTSTLRKVLRSFLRKVYLLAVEPEFGNKAIINLVGGPKVDLSGDRISLFIPNRGIFAIYENHIWKVSPKWSLKDGLPVTFTYVCDDNVKLEILAAIVENSYSEEAEGVEQEWETIGATRI
jgi:hypothetical protein